MTSGSSLSNPRRKHALACLKTKKSVSGCVVGANVNLKNVQLGVAAFGGSSVALKGAV